MNYVFFNVRYIKSDFFNSKTSFERDFNEYSNNYFLSLILISVNIINTPGNLINI